MLVKNGCRRRGRKSLNSLARFSGQSVVRRLKMPDHRRLMTFNNAEGAERRLLPVLMTSSCSQIFSTPPARNIGSNENESLGYRTTASKRNSYHHTLPVSLRFRPWLEKVPSGHRIAGRNSPRLRAPYRREWLHVSAAHRLVHNER